MPQWSRIFEKNNKRHGKVLIMNKYLKFETYKCVFGCMRVYVGAYIKKRLEYYFWFVRLEGASSFYYL